MFSRTHAVVLVALLIGISALAPATAAAVDATGESSRTATADVDVLASTDTSTLADPENNTTTARNLTAERVVSLIQSGRAIAENRTGDVAAWVEANAASLNRSQAETVYRFLLSRAAAGAETVGPALDAAQARVPDDRARSLTEQVAASLPTEDVADLRDRLAGLGSGWSLNVSGWLSGGVDRGPTTTTATTTAPTITTASTSTPTTTTPTGESDGSNDASPGERGSYRGADYGAVEADRGETAMNSTRIQRELAPGLAVVDREWRDGYALFTVVNARPGTVRLTVTDSNSIETSGGSFTVSREQFTLPQGRFVLKVPASSDRGDQTVIFASGTMTQPIGFSDTGGGGGFSPFSGTPTFAWLSGAFIAISGAATGAKWILWSESGEPIKGEEMVHE